MSDKKLTVKYTAVICAAIMLSVFGSLRSMAQEKLPKPQIVLSEKKDVVNNGYEMTSFRLDVENKFEFPAEMFEAAPDLPPCGRNTNSSRTWIDIISEKGKRIYGYCAIKSPDELSNLIFLVPRNQIPDKVYIVIYDRRLKKRSKSQTISLNEN